MFGVAAQHAGAQRMERAEPEALGGLAEDGGDPFAHLAGRLVGEGDGQDLVGEGAFGQQDMGEAGGQHAGLAGAGAGEHQQRAIDGFDRLALFGIEAGQVVGHRDRYSPGTRAGQSHRRPGMLPPIASGGAAILLISRKAAHPDGHRGKDHLASTSGDLDRFRRGNGQIRG